MLLRSVSLATFQRLRELNIEIFEDDAEGKDYSRISDGDVVIFPAFGATVQEMQLFKDKNVKMVDTTCPWVAKVGCSSFSSLCNLPQKAAAVISHC